MSKLPIFTPNKIISILEKKGFEKVRVKGSHYIFKNKNEKRYAIVPMHKKDLPKGTFYEILKQAGISIEEIKKYI